MNKQSIPELQRIPLEEICLSILAGNLAPNCLEFLMQAPQPPSSEAVHNALKVLEEVNAIEPLLNKTDGSRAEAITPLGVHLSKLPVPIRLGKMLIFGVLFKVLDKTLTIAASLSSKSPFSANINDSQQATAAHKSFSHPKSDFLTICNVWDAFCEACKVSKTNGRRFCDRNFLNFAAFLEIRDTRNQFIELLTQIGFINSSTINSMDEMIHNDNFQNYFFREPDWNYIENLYIDVWNIAILCHCEWSFGISCKHYRIPCGIS